MTGTLYLLPNLLDESANTLLYLPQSVSDALTKIDGMICESERTARRYIVRFTTKKHVSQMPLALLNEHTKDSELDALLEPLKKGQHWGLLSDAGLPCIADPGAKLVSKAHEHGIHVEAFVGPCSIILALMLSGFSGQHFAFHGYLPKDASIRKSKIAELEKESIKNHSTQIFIEAPYRNQELLSALVSTLMPSTKLCVAVDLLHQDQKVISKEISKWKAMPLPDINKKPAIFLLFADKE